MPCILASVKDDIVYLVCSSSLHLAESLNPVVIICCPDWKRGFVNVIAKSQIEEI